MAEALSVGLRPRGRELGTAADRAGEVTTEERALPSASCIIGQNPARRHSIALRPSINTVDRLADAITGPMIALV